MHALGFHHEHTRPDRDQYIRVDQEMLEQFTPSRAHNYRVLPAELWDTSGHAFELNSVMNYNSQKWMTTQDMGIENKNRVGKMTHFLYRKLFGRSKSSQKSSILPNFLIKLL